MARKRPRKPAPPLPPPRESMRLYARLAPRHIAMFRFLLEAQDNLGYMSVLDRGVGGGQTDADARPDDANVANGPDMPEQTAADAEAPGTLTASAAPTSAPAATPPNTATGADAVLRIVFSPHQEREMRSFLDGMRAAIPFQVFESPLRR